MNDFEKLVEDCRASSSTKNITNATIDHALVLFRALFKDAKEKGEDVRIVSGCLKPSFYEQLVEQANELLSAGIKISVVVPQSHHLEDNAFAQLLKKHENGRLIKIPSSVESHTPHFILVGSSRYRLEQDHEQCTATACFSNSIVGTFLLGLFNHLVTLAGRRPAGA